MPPGRAGSPELGRPQLGTRPKLRRSQSACDVREIRTLKRMVPTLAPIPAKTSRFLSSTTIAEAAGSGTSRSGFTASKLGSTTGCIKKTVGANVTAGNRLNTLKKPVKSTSSCTASSAGAAGKTITKRIPPYDYKARYNDLLEKHKLLKEKFEEAKNQILLFENLPEEYEEAQAQLMKIKDQLRNAKIDIEFLEKDNNSKNMKIESITKALQTTSDELEMLKEKHEVRKRNYILVLIRNIVFFFVFL